MATISIPLTPEQYEQLTRPLTGDPRTWGGFQRLLARMQAGLSGPGEVPAVRMTVEDLLRAIRYCQQKYGPGGYQSRLRPVEPALRSAWEALPTDRGLFNEGELP